MRAFVNHSIERYFRQKFHFIAEELRLSLLRNSDNKAKLAKIHNDAASFLIESEQERLQRKSMSFETSSKVFAAIVLVALVIMFALVPNVLGEGSDIEISPTVLGVFSLIVLVVLPLSLFTYVNIRHPPSLTEKLPVEELDRYNTSIYKRFVPILRSRFVAITILFFGALLVLLPLLSGLPVSLTLLTSADKSKWTVSVSRRVFRVVVSLALTLCCVLMSIFVWSKPRRLPREMRKRSRRTVSRFNMYKDTFREAKIKLEDIPKTLRFKNENDLISSRLSMMMKEEKEDQEDESKTSSKSSKESSSNNKEEEDMFLDLEQDQDDVPWLDTVDLVKRFRELDTCFLNSKLVRRILKTSKNIPQDVRGSEFRVDYETYASVGEFPYFSLGHGLISRGLRSRKFRYLYDHESRRFIFQRTRAFCMIFSIIPLIVVLPLTSLLDISKEWREVLITFSVSAPILFLGTILFVALRGATPNPLKRAFGPLVSWYVLVIVTRRNHLRILT